MSRLGSPIARLVLAGLVPLWFAGCASMPLWPGGKHEYDKADVNNPAVKCVCLWQPAEGHGLDDLPSRGFAGQIFFLTQTSPTPVEVDGDVSIYVFDDQGSVDERTQPIHQFNFRGGAWKKYLKVTAWGPTYQIFIPYTRKGDQEANCELRVRLKPVDGPTVFSDQATIWLPGAQAENIVPAAPRAPNRRPELLTVSHEEPIRGDGRPRSKPGLDSHPTPVKQFQSYTVPQ